MQYKYEVKYEASYHIWSFYRNVARKIWHTQDIGTTPTPSTVTR